MQKVGAFAIAALMLASVLFAYGLPAMPQVALPDFTGAFEQVLGFFFGEASAAAKTWDNGGGADTNWNTATNWDLDTLPVAADTVTFDTGDGAVTVNIATPALGSFTMTAAYANTITITIAQTNSWGTVAVNAGTLNGGTFNFVFASLTVASAGTVTMDTITSSNYVFSADTGTISLTDFTKMSGENMPLRQWTFNPSAAGAAVTVTFNGLPVLTQYQLLRDGIVVDTDTTSAAGSITYVVTGGWSSHVMQITIPGGGGPPTEPPAQPPVVPAGISIQDVGLVLVAIGAVTLLVAVLLPRMVRGIKVPNYVLIGALVLILVGAVAYLAA